MVNPMSLLPTPDPLSLLPVTHQKARIVTPDLGLLDDGYVDLEFQFNPSEVGITRGAEWSEETIRDLNMPDLVFQGGKAATYSLSLVFDTSQNIEYRDVRMYTNQLLKLTMMYGDVGDDRPSPPLVQFLWGEFSLFYAVVEEVSVNYTLFDPDGTPTRAKVTVKLKQRDYSDDFQGFTNPTTRTEPRRTRIVHQGDRLDLIAYEEYGAAHHWRHLAEANGLDNPQALYPGQVLAIPPLP
jgi:hypothetical protein